MAVSLMDSLEKYMDVLAVRQKLVASNIANIDTPGYRTQDVDFQTEFTNHLTGQSSTMAHEVSGLQVKNDGNSVNLDRESQLMSENSIRFSAATNLLRGAMRTLKSAIHDGNAA